MLLYDAVSSELYMKIKRKSEKNLRVLLPFETFCFKSRRRNQSLKSIFQRNLFAID